MPPASAVPARHVSVSDGLMGEGSDLVSLGGWPAALSAITSGQQLNASLIAAVMSEILRGQATSAQIAAYAVGMRTKGETIAELSAALEAMERFGVVVPLSDDVRAKAICTCGTGGDRSHSINISTTAAFVVAGAGGLVCKHGGRAASSASGSADVLEALGVALEISAQAVARCVTEAGVGFCLAPRFHPALRHAGPTRRELGVATMFNFLGPLANPGRIGRQFVGVSDASMAPKMLGVLSQRNADRAIVVFGHDGLDELTTTTTSTMLVLRNGEITSEEVDPQKLGFKSATLADLRGGTATENAAHLRSVLEGRLGPHRDIVVLNAAGGCVVAGLAESLSEGVELARESIDSGRAAHSLDELVRISTEALSAEAAATA